MNQVDQNINKDMFDSDLIDVDSLDFSDDQTWLCTLPEDSGEKVDIVDWNISCDWPISEDDEYQQAEKKLNKVLDNILKSESFLVPDKHKFDSRTYVKPKKRILRPSIQHIVEVSSNPPSMSPHPSLNPAITLNSTYNTSNITPANKYLTYNKYNSPLGAMSPLLRLKTFNVDTHTENSSAIKEYALKRRSLIQDDDPQLEDLEMAMLSEGSGFMSMENTPSKPINIDLSQPAHNLHNTFNKGLTNNFNERSSLDMIQSAEFLMRMSPPSLVSSSLMENSGTFNPESMEGRKPMPSHKDSGLLASGRDSIDPMMTSMTYSIIEEKDMNTSLLSQTTYPDNESLIDSLPPSLVSSVNSSYVISNNSKPRESTDSNIFSSATFTHLEQSEKLLSARPRCPLYNSFTKRESGIRNSESYTKSREEACQIDANKVLNENTDKNEMPKTKPNEMGETITLHYSNNKFTDAEKENFERDDTFYKEMGVEKPEDRNLNVTRGKQELNEIIQARQKLSLARRTLPSEPDKPLPNQVVTSPVRTIHLPNQTITVPKHSMENASELLSRRRAMNNGIEKPEETHRDMQTRESPKRHATFKVSPKISRMDTTVVHIKADEGPGSDNNIIDINSATMTLLGDTEATLQQEDWGSQERAMVGSSESTDTGTFSSSSPPDSVPDTAPAHDPRNHTASTPLISLRQNAKNDLLNLHNTISPIYDTADDKSYTLAKASSNLSPMERTYDMHHTTVINNATMIKRGSAKRDILAGKATNSDNYKSAPTSQVKSPNRVPPTATASHGSVIPPAGLLRKSTLPTSKLRQYSSHRELSRIPGGTSGPRAAPAPRPMVRRVVYASNPALSPTAPAPPLHFTDLHKESEKLLRPTLTNPPPLVRQGTETLRRDRPTNQLAAPRDLRGAGSGVPVSMRNHHITTSSTRPYSIAGPTQMRVTAAIARPASGTATKTAPVMDQPRPASSSEARVSALPRPSRLPAPRRGLRPPSVYTVAPTADADHY